MLLQSHVRCNSGKRVNASSRKADNVLVSWLTISGGSADSADVGIANGRRAFPLMRIVSGILRAATQVGRGQEYRMPIIEACDGDHAQESDGQVAELQWLWIERMPALNGCKMRLGVLLWFFSDQEGLSQMMALHGFVANLVLLHAVL